jgi:hypothetical protein
MTCKATLKDSTKTQSCPIVGNSRPSRPLFLKHFAIGLFLTLKEAIEQHILHTATRRAWVSYFLYSDPSTSFFFMYHSCRRRFQSLVAYPSQQSAESRFFNGSWQGEEQSHYLPGDSLINCPLRLPATSTASMALQHQFLGHSSPLAAHDPRMFSPYFESTASAPSLRASEADIMRTFGGLPGVGTVATQNSDNDSSNIKVVVRVRQFVQRGTRY